MYCIISCQVHRNTHTHTHTAGSEGQHMGVVPPLWKQELCSSRWSDSFYCHTDIFSIGWCGRYSLSNGKTLPPSPFRTWHTSAYLLQIIPGKTCEYRPNQDGQNVTHKSHLQGPIGLSNGRLRHLISVTSCLCWCWQDSVLQRQHHVYSRVPTERRGLPGPLVSDTHASSLLSASAQMWKILTRGGYFRVYTFIVRSLFYRMIAFFSFFVCLNENVEGFYYWCPVLFSFSATSQSPNTQLC